jgi:hypothetical protein
LICGLSSLELLLSEDELDILAIPALDVHHTHDSCIDLGIMVASKALLAREIHHGLQGHAA